MEPYKTQRATAPTRFCTHTLKSLRSDTLADAISFALAHASSVLLIKIMQNRIMFPTSLKTQVALSLFVKLHASEEQIVSRQQ